MALAGVGLPGENTSISFQNWKAVLRRSALTSMVQSVETTQIYIHVMQKPGLGVRSPLER